MFSSFELLLYCSHGQQQLVTIILVTSPGHKVITVKSIVVHSSQRVMATADGILAMMQLQPPSAMVMLTRISPRITIEIPIAQGRRPVMRPYA